MISARFFRACVPPTLAAAAAALLYASLPEGPRLAPLDFLADEASVLQLCDPLNPRPLALREDRPKVAMAFPAGVPSVRPGAAIFTLTTVSGRPVGPEDLRLVGGKRIRLIVRAPGRPDFSAEAEPGASLGQWIVYLPASSGPRRAWAEFTPVATGEPLSSSAALP